MMRRASSFVIACSSGTSRHRSDHGKFGLTRRVSNWTAVAPADYCGAYAVKKISNSAGMIRLIPSV